IDGAHEDVTPDLVRAEPELAVRSLGEADRVEHVVEEVVRTMADELREQRCAEGDDDELEDHGRAGDRDPVLAQARPEEVPRRPADDAFADLRSGFYVFLG